MRYKFREYEFDSSHVSCKDFSFLRQATKQAFNSNHHRFRLGAIVVKSGRVLSHGINIPKKSPITPPYRESIHAEVNAIRNAKNPSGATLYVARLSATDELAIAKPCEYCVEHMIENGIQRVVYSVSNNNAESYYIDSINWLGYKSKSA
jgi:deoxycytidylate deaminase